MSDAFRTFQTVKKYEDALARHAQKVRWTRALLCPCVDGSTNQVDPNCSICFGRGHIYKTPGIQSILQEEAKHDHLGKVYTGHMPIVGTPKVYHQGVELTLGTPPGDGSYIQLATPYPRGYSLLVVDYSFDPRVSITDENSGVVGTNTLRTIATRGAVYGKSYEGSVAVVSKVYNVDRSENYTVGSFAKEYIFLTGMGTWQSGDVLEVSYKYVPPFDFMISGVTQKMRYENHVVLEQADAVLVTPNWARIAPDDMLTSLAQEQYGRMIINPNVTGAGNTDAIATYFDIASLTTLVDVYGIERELGTDYELYSRNEIKWLTTKPTVAYSIEFLYHPTYRALLNIPTARNAENKAFVNRVALVQAERKSSVVNF